MIRLLTLLGWDEAFLTHIINGIVRKKPLFNELIKTRSCMLMLFAFVMNMIQLCNVKKSLLGLLFLRPGFKLLSFCVHLHQKRK